MKLLMRLSFLFILISCLDSEMKVQEVLYTQDSVNNLDIHRNVVIKGTSDDVHNLEFVNVIDNFFFSKNYYGKGQLSNGVLTLELDSISSPRFLQFSAFSKDSIYRSELFVTPGDTVIFEIKDKNLIFKGKNAVFNNLFSELYDNTQEYAEIYYTNNLEAYKTKIKGAYNEKISFFNQYIRKHNIASENFYDLVKDQLKLEYMGNLIKPRYMPTTNSNLYIGDQNGLRMILLKEYSTSENLFNMNNYLDNVSLEDFKKPELLGNRYFRNYVNLFIRDYFNTSSEYSLYSKEKLLSDKKFVEKNFDGDLESLILAVLIIDYADNGFGYSLSNVETLKRLIDDYEKKFPSSAYIKITNEIKSELGSYNFKLTPIALESKLVDRYGDTLTLNDVFKRSTQRIRIIDFWASWCPPCIDEIKKVKDFKDKLAVEKDVEWIYLSIDDDYENWAKTSEDLRDFLNVRNQYFVVDGNNAPLTRALKVDWIPKYVIFNSKNEIVLENAPRPSDTLMYKKIIDEIGLRK